MAAVVDLQLPAGFRFHPTDEELVMHYLCRKCASRSIAVPIIAEIDLYKYGPWDLPGMALYGEKEWYFFSPRDRKYPNGSRPNRSAGCGYWKATGADKPIGNPKPVGIKKALVFYSGKAPRGEKTNWIMHEYRLADVDRKKSNGSLRLDDWVLCRIYNKKGTIELHRSSKKATTRIDNDVKATTTIDNDVKQETSVTTAAYDDFLYLDASDSIPSCSDHLSPEAESFQKAAKWDDFPFEEYLDLEGCNSVEEVQDISGFLDYINKPFQILA